jgi:AP-1 complex subunit sigma 1/2
MLINRRGLIRLVKWFDMSHIPDKDKYMREVAITVIGRSSKLCNFMEWGEYKIIYKRYASLYFITLCDKDENELKTLEIIHHFVECLDRYFGSVCELDIIFNYHKAYYIVEEILAAGFIQESDKKSIIKNLQLQDSQLHEEKEIEYNTNNK